MERRDEITSIADVFVTVLPETSKVAVGIERALRNVDVRKIAKEWAREIEAALRGIDAEVDLSVDVAKAKAQIEKASKDQKSKLQVDADTASAKAKVQLLDKDIQGRRRTITYHVDIDKNQLAAMGLKAGQALGDSVGAGASSSSAALASLGGVMKSLSQSGAMMTIVVTEAAAVLVELAGVAAAASGALGVLPAAFAAVGVGAGVLMVGLNGITDALDAASAAHKSAGKDAADHARSVQSASRTVASAQQSLSSAVKNETQAQKDVARARRDALHELQDINDELRNGAIDETQANLDLAKAREELATGTFSSSLDYQQAQLNVIKAEQRAKEAHQGNIETQQEANDKRAKGVEGADQVVAAEQRLADAQQNTANAQQALADAQTRLTEANSEVSTSAQKAADAMGGLSANGQALVNTLIALQPVWQTFRNSIQDPLTAGLGPMLVATINAVLPAITPGLQRIATAFNTMFMGIGAWLQDPENLAMIQVIIGNIATAFENLAPAVGPLLDIFATLTDVGSSFLPAMARDLADVVRSFSEWVAQKAATGELAHWIQVGLDTVKQLGPFVLNLVDSFMKLAPIGVAILPDIIRSIEAIVAVIPKIGPLLVALGPSFGAIELAAKMVSVAVDGIKKAVEFMWKIVKPIFDAYKTVLEFIVDKVKWLIDHIPGLPDLPSNFWTPSGPAPAPGAPAPGAPGAPAPAPGAPTGPYTPGGPAAAPGAPAPAPPSGPAPSVPGGRPAANAPTADLPGGIPLIPDPNRPGFWTSPNPDWAALIKRESGGNPTAIQGSGVHDANTGGNEAEGLFQIAKSTWVQNGGTQFAPTPRQASPQEQAVIAARIFSRNPSGSDWGAGPGRESPTGLAAGVPSGAAPAAAAPAGPSPAPPAGPSPAAPGASTSVPSVPGEQVGTTAGRLRINAATGLNTGSGWRQPDTFDEHSGGNAVDFMVGLNNKAKGDQVMAEAFKDPNVDYVLWQQRNWKPDGSSTPMPDRGSPTANHMDHVHVHYKSTGYAAGNEPGTTGMARGANAAAAPSTPTPQAGVPSGPIALNPVIPAGQQAASKDSAKNYGKDLGSDIMSGMFEVFGLGDIFKDPTEFGLFKIFKSFLGLKPASTTGSGSNAGSTNAANGTGTGNPLIDMLGSFLPNISGGTPPGITAPQAAGPTAEPSLGNTVTAAALAPPAPGTVDNSNQGNINLTMQNAPADEKFIMDTVDTTLINNGPNRSILRGGPK